MIYITGDCHQDFQRFQTHNFPEQFEMTKEDFVIICGDFGGIWNNSETEHEKRLMDDLESLPFTTLFVDGNHENYDRLYAFPEEIWHGGKVHKIRPSVIHLMRGQVFEIGGKYIFTFGGARSHDISGGVLDPGAPDYKEQLQRAKRGYEPFRIKHVSWWDQEMPSEEEFEEGLRNLETVGYQVDFIVTHCAPTDVQALFSGGLYSKDQLTDYLMELEKRTEFVKWFFGHYHDNRNVLDRFVMIYEQIIRIV